MKAVLKSADRDEDVFCSRNAGDILRRMGYWLELIEEHHLDFTIEVTQDDVVPDASVCAYCDATGVELEGIDPCLGRPVPGRSPH